ncbi:MAG: MFS transporter [Bacteroidia bacterium]|nr:MFS transporter [Bacteroidia bacterium]
MNKVGVRNWFSLIIAGLVGQFAWTIENMFLNLYIFEQTQNAGYVPWMVAFSAAAATITTLLMGALSDRLGKRKAFVSFGYIAWGVSVLSFAFLTKENMVYLFPTANAALLSGVFIIVLDCIMTFFGSTANDAAFNAYATDISTPNTSGKIESVLSILPLISMLVIFGGFSGMASGSGWFTFFLIFGCLTALAGIASLFLFPKDVAHPNKDEPYIKNIFYGFKPRVVKTNPLLYLTLLSFLAFAIAIQTFMPYFLIFIQENLGFVGLDFTIIMGSVLLVACIFTVIVGLFMDKLGKNRIILPSLAVTLIGLVGMFFAKSMVWIIIAGIVLMSGYMISTAVLGSKIRDYTPRKEVGLFQGIRMIFVVLIPMVSGPFIGQAAYMNTAATYINEYGEAVKLPNEYIYIAAAVVLLLAIAPVIVLIIKDRKANRMVDING